MSEIADETRDEIMIATVEALKKHGYADLTTQKIADEFDKSQSLIHYHYGTKESVVEAFLGYYTDLIEEEIESAREVETSREALWNIIDVLLMPEDEEATDLGIAVFEIHARAPRTEGYRKKIDEMNSLIEDRIAEVVDEGIEATEFHGVDSEEVAFIVSSITAGANINGISVDENFGERARKVLENYVVDDLYRG